jgi:hypothetical protein
MSSKETFPATHVTEPASKKPTTMTLGSSGPSMDTPTPIARAVQSANAVEGVGHPGFAVTD